MCHAGCPNDSKKGRCLSHPARLQSERCCGRAGTPSLFTSDPRTPPGACSVGVRTASACRGRAPHPISTSPALPLRRCGPLPATRAPLPGSPAPSRVAPAPWAPHPACAPPACGISPLASPGREGPAVSFPRRPCHSCQGRTEPAHPISEERSTPQGASAQAAPDPAGFLMAHVSQDLHSGLAV